MASWGNLLDSHDTLLAGMKRKHNQEFGLGQDCRVLAYEVNTSIHPSVPPFISPVLLSDVAFTMTFFSVSIGLLLCLHCILIMCGLLINFFSPSRYNSFFFSRGQRIVCQCVCVFVSFQHYMLETWPSWLPADTTDSTRKNESIGAQARGVEREMKEKGTKREREVCPSGWNRELGRERASATDLNQHWILWSGKAGRFDTDSIWQ